MTSKKPSAATRVGQDFRFIAVCILLLVVPVRALAQTMAIAEQSGDHPICQLIESAARANGLPIDFFARVIWQESRFQPDVIGPLTRSGEHAEGIAQFMPGTAAEKGLYEPFNPVAALPKSGEFLAELRTEFGNLGLAAAAYNAGPQRVRDFLTGLRDLPAETRNYVLAITGHPVEDWALAAKENSDAGRNGEPQLNGAPENCHDLVALLERERNSFVAAWQGRSFPSWCRGLRHPDISICGPVHAVGPMLGPTSAVRPPRSHVHLATTSSR